MTPIATRAPPRAADAPAPASARARVDVDARGSWHFIVCLRPRVTIVAISHQPGLIRAADVVRLAGEGTVRVASVE